MYLSQIEIKKFRQFSDFSVEFNKGLNLLVGENNAGKSSLIDAIRLVLDTTSAEWVSFKTTDFSAGEKELSIKLKFENLSLNEAALFLEYITTEINEEKSNLVLYLHLNAKLVEHYSSRSPMIKTEIRSGANGEGPTIDREIRSYLSVTYLKPLRDADNELSAGRSSRLSQILGSTNSLAGKKDVVKRLIELLIKANTDIKGDDAIKESQEQIEHFINELTFRSDTFKPSLNILGSKQYDEMGESDKLIALKTILEKLSLQLDATGVKHGLGYSSLLSMATELMLLKQDEHSYPLLLVEEPEAHLHPQLQMKFIKYLRNSSTKIQSILSTHSPVLASKAPLDSLILMQGGSAYPIRPDLTELEKDDYIFLEKFLDSTKANMFFARGVIFVEGVAEVVLLPKFAELLGRPLEDYGVSIVNVNGLSRKRYTKVFKPKLDIGKGLPIKVACVTDLDLWPDEAEKSAENAYGFKEKKQPNTSGQGGNLSYWLSSHSSESLIAKKQKKSEFDGKNIKTFISEDWTFEFCLAKYGLAEELFEAIKGSLDEFSDLSSDNHLRAIQIYSLIENGKSETSYLLSNLLDTKSYRTKDLAKKLPPYIIEAIEFVTEKIIDESLDESEGSDVEVSSV